MSDVQFKKLSNRSIKAKKLNDLQFKQRSEGGIALLFDIESNIGGFRFLHCANQRFNLSYIVLYFPLNEDSKPIAYELSLKEFHMYVSYWIINIQIEDGEIKMPPGKPTPLENLVWCMSEMIKNS